METIVLIPHYNHREILDECLISLREQTYKNFKTVIVDDGSTDNSVDYIKEYFPEIDVYALGKNHGFARAVNEGIRYILKNYNPIFIAILNNDTRVDKDWLLKLVQRAKTDKRIAAVTSNMFFYNHPDIINSQGGTLDWNGDGYDINFGISCEKGKQKSEQVFGSCWGASLVRVEIFNKIGFLDEKFNAYFEDLDWSWRANVMGYRIFFEKNAIVYHKHSTSYGNNQYRKIYFCKKNALRAALKNYETKNLFRKILYILIGYWFAVVGYFRTNKYQMSFIKKITYMSIPFFALSWNLFYLPDTLWQRQAIQRKRKKTDEAIFKLIQPDATPVREWIKNLKNKFILPLLLVVRTTQRMILFFANPVERFGSYLKRYICLNKETTHGVILPFINRVNQWDSYFKRHNFSGVNARFQTVVANLPFSFTFLKKQSSLDNEVSFVINACLFCFQLSSYHKLSRFRYLSQKIFKAARSLRNNSLQWGKVIILAKEANALSQVLFYLRLIQEIGGPSIPEEVMDVLKKDGSHLQNMLLDRIDRVKLLHGEPSFFLKLYSKMYLEQGVLKYLTSKAHALYNRFYNREKVEKNFIENKSQYNPRIATQPLKDLMYNGVNIFGFLDSESGVGEAARTLIRSVERAGIPYALLNSPHVPHRRRENQFARKFGKDNPYFVNLIAIYGDMFAKEWNYFGDNKFRNHYNIAYWTWELSHLPFSWVSLLGRVNEVWAASSFAASAIKEANKKVPVMVVPHAIEVKNYPYSRAHFGLPDDKFLFLFMFDFYSIFERKNPLAVVRAFKKAFQKNEPVELIIKCSNSKIDQTNFRALKTEAKTHNIRLINSYLEREEINSLINVCDCYVSLHRSEGFGLIIAEAMALRKPVIATNYSGNTDFMTEENSFPIRYTLVPLNKDYGLYTRGSFWAEPDEDQAAEQMRLVYEVREVAARKGMFAQRDIVMKFSPEIVGRLIMKRLRSIWSRAR